MKTKKMTSGMIYYEKLLLNQRSCISRTKGIRRTTIRRTNDSVWEALVSDKERNFILAYQATNTHLIQTT